MKELYEIKEQLMDELKSMSKKGVSSSNLEMIHKLTDTIKNIDKICMYEEDDGYSQAGYSQNGYDAGNSYRRHYVRGHYSRDGYSQDGYSQGGYSQNYSERRGYSRDDGRGHMIKELQEKLRGADGREREAIETVMEMLR